MAEGDKTVAEGPKSTFDNPLRRAEVGAGKKVIICQQIER